MDSDPRALSDMSTSPAIQTPHVAQSYMMDDANANGRPQGSHPLFQLITNIMFQAPGQRVTDEHGLTRIPNL